MVRLAQPADFPAIDRMLHDSKWSSSQALLDRDSIVVTGAPGDPTGVLVARPSFFIHDIAVKLSIGQTNHVARMVAGALVMGRARLWPINHAIFRVDLKNEPMLKFHRALGSVDEDGQMLSYTFPQV